MDYIHNSPSSTDIIKQSPKVKEQQLIASIAKVGDLALDND